jgi:hypothetical protein
MKGTRSKTSNFMPEIAYYAAKRIGFKTFKSCVTFERKQSAKKKLDNHRFT